MLSAVTSSSTSSQPMRVILDVGAQIIELSNLQVAQRWLDLVPSDEADAVIFFNEHDELSVLTRNGIVDSFLTSPFATQTDRCLVYLDQAHTRGTDLRLPDFYRAAVTLGPGVTKDTLVQACMRMRKLGSGQSVTFCASPEMQKRIRTLARVEDDRRLTVTDVLVCAIAETWDDVHRSVPLWATQGIRYQRQQVVWDRADGAGRLSAKDVQDYLEDEAQSLEQRYRPLGAQRDGVHPHGLSSKLTAATEISSRQVQVAQIRDKCVSFGLSELDPGANLQEEQERELAPEIEQERHVERPPPRQPAVHELHGDVVKFAQSGILTTESKAFMPAFAALADTSASALFPAADFPSALLATADFARTVKPLARPSLSDVYQRPVQWLLTQAAPEARYGMHMVIVSPWEANRLKPLLLRRQQQTPRSPSSDPAQRPTVHLRAYLPRTSLSHPSFEDLEVYNIPSSPAAPRPPRELATQLNLFAGQLYLRGYGEYVRLCRYLGLAYRENEGETEVAADGFVGRRAGGTAAANGGGGGGAGNEEGVDEEYQGCEFERSPVAFLGVLVKRVRRDCLDIERTHMGRILAGEILREEDFEEEEG